MNDDKNDGAVHWLHRAARRAATQVPLKVFGIAAFLVLFFAAYFHLLHHPLFPVTVMPVTIADRWIGFHPWALGFYASLWLYVVLPVALQPDRRRLLSYGCAAAGLSLAGMAVFLFWPTATPQPDINWALYPSFGFLKTVDQAGNACPSLHAAFAIFSGLWLDRLLRQMGARILARTINGCWCLGILFSTVATRQHVALDLAAGIALGVLAFALHRYFMLRAPRPAERCCPQAPLPAPETRPGE